MDDLAQELASLRDEVVPAWSEARSDRLYAAVGQLRRRRRTQRIALGTVAAALVFGVGYWQWVPAAGLSLASVRSDARDTNARNAKHTVDTSESTESRPAATSASKLADTNKPRLRARQHLQLADGSHVNVVSSDGDLTVERNEREHIGLRLASGVARFDVVPNTQRQFVVNAGSVEIGVVGTVFDVERAADRVRVGVREGKVRVRVADRVAFVTAGQSLWFDEAGVRESAASSSHASVKARAVRARRAPSHDETPRAAWRSLGQSGDYEGAYRLLAEGTAVEDDSEALMDAADAARLSGHAEAAVTYLRKVLRDHRAAPVAPLAAFTLGRVLLERLGQPLEAADAFAVARTIAPQGSLAQDALAREVEAWSKAGHPDEAYQRARQYVQSYPEGRRLRAVQLYGGLPAP